MTKSFLARSTQVLFLTGIALSAACAGGANNTVTGPTPTEAVSSSSSSPTPTPAPSPAPSTQGCTTSVNNLPSTVSAVGGRHAFTIATAANCPWTATSDSAWADVAPGSGHGNASLTLTVAPNSIRDARTATVVVNSQTLRVIQTAAGCSYAVNHTSLDLNADSSGASIALTTTQGCGWGATSSESWIRVLTPSGMGSATISLAISSNSGDVRHAFLTIAGQRVNVTQQTR